MPRTPDTLRMILGLFASMVCIAATKSMILRPTWQNFLNNFIGVQWSIAPSSFAQRMFLVASWALWLFPKLLNRIKLRYTFKLNTVWSNAQRVRINFNTTNHSEYQLWLELSWSRNIPAVNYSVYQNITTLLTHPCPWNHITDYH